MNQQPYSLIPQTQTINNSKKPRKPYTITKQRENWTDEEHQKFLDALRLYDRDWKKIEAHIGTKTVIQIRSHAQKYFLKVQKNNTGEHVPPPRPKRKATSQLHSAKIKQLRADTVTIPWATAPPDSINLSNPFLYSASPFTQWISTQNVISYPMPDPEAQRQQLQQAHAYIQRAMISTQNASNSTPTSSTGPNFSKIYSFLASLFDTQSNNHIEKLSEMSNIDRETVQLLMHNLAINLANQQFREQHSILMDQYRSVLQSSSEEGDEDDEEEEEEELTEDLEDLEEQQGQSKIDQSLHQSLPSQHHQMQQLHEGFSNTDFLTQPLSLPRDSD